MVAHISYKFTHLAQSLRAGHLTNTLRNALPSTATPAPTFDFTSNAFGAASNAASNVGGSTVGIGMAAGAFGAGAGAGAAASAGSGGAAGGAGGASSKAGSWSPFNFQTGKPVNPGQAAQADSPSQLEDDDLRAFASSSVRRSLVRVPRSSPSTLRPRQRHNSLSSPSRPSHPDLLRADEAGLSGVRLSGAEMQRLYHSAVEQGRKSQQAVEELEREADEIDLGVPETSVLSTGRRASVSLSGLATPRSAPLVSTTGLSLPASRRTLHSSSSAPAASPAPIPALSSSPSRPTASTSSTPAFPSSVPPTASIPSHRRFSTSSVPSAASEPLLAPGDVPFRRTKSIKEHRPPIDGERRKKPFFWARHKEQREVIEEGKARGDLLSPEQMERKNAILAAEKTGRSDAVQNAVRQYLAEPSAWSTGTHNTAMQALTITRRPNEPIDRIVELYNQLFSTPSLHPTRTSYDIVIRAFCYRDEEVRKNIGFLERRIKKKVLAGAARGPWWIADPNVAKAGGRDDADGLDSNDTLGREHERLKQLRSADYNYFRPALQIFQALGPLGDRLGQNAVQLLLSCAATHGEVDVALALFERLEKSRFQRPTHRAYETLLQMYGEVEKDVELVKEIFEAYLVARGEGRLHGVELKSAASNASRPAFRYNSVKHAFDTEPEYILDDLNHGGRSNTVSADERVWAAAVSALFEAGDAAGAVALLERLLVAQNSEDGAPVGYPKTLGSYTVSQVVVGLIKTGDYAAAREWLDRFMTTRANDGEAIPLAFFTLLLVKAVDASTASLVNHVYRLVLSRVSKENPLFVSDFYLVVDRNLKQVWSESSTGEEKLEAFEAIAEFRAAFESATKAGLLNDVGNDFTASTGLLGRIAIAEGAHGLFDRATSTFVQLANIARAVMRDTPSDDVAAREQGFRPRYAWVLRVRDVASAALGLERVGHGTNDVQLRALGSPVPAIRNAAQVASWTNKLARVTDTYAFVPIELAVVYSYLTSRAQAGSDPRALSLTGDDWFTVLEAFAHVGAYLARSAQAESTGAAPVVLPFDFPGFKLAFEDFVSTGVEIPVGHGLYDYDTVARKLKQSSMKVDEVRSVIETMARNVSFEPAAVESEPAVEQAKPAAIEVAEDDAASLVSGSEAPATSATSASLADSAEPIERIVTPPPTPPSYFSQLPDVSPPPSAPAAPTFDVELGKQIEEWAFVQRAAAITESESLRATLSAFQLATSAAQEGRFAHPDSYGKLVEQLGRLHRVQEVRQTYLIAYAALNAMQSVPDQQSVAWVMLEDRMIVALAQAGELVDVGHHRTRLLEAGSAPSADAYAAMILHFKDTTDDAHVALSLFEESQRLGVRPNVYLFNTLISKLSRARRSKEALEYFELMKLHGLVPSSITYGAIINACCKTGDDVSAEYLFKEMVSRPDFKPRAPPYNTLMQHYCSTKPDRARALHYYDEMIKAKVQPTAHTYKLLLDVYGAIAPSNLEAMQKVFERIVNDRRVSVSGAHWAAMINAYGVVAKDVDRALAIFDSISAHPSAVNNPNGPLPDAVVYEALLNALIANGKAELCDQYLREMHEKGVRMTAYVANTLIKGYTAQSLFPRARAIFSAMSEPPSGVASLGNHPIDRHPKHHHQSLQHSATQAVDAPTYREPSTYEAMIVCELKAGETVRAAEVLRLAEARAFPPAVIGRLQKLLIDEGIEVLPLQ
ncbi:hypothetical protein JCM8547_000296 [Rhodosporidiobolus lusitaniae]